MPSRGRRRSPGTARFIVGKPSSLPRFAPCTTVPRTPYGRPRRRAAPSTSPARRALRIRVELTTSPPCFTGAATTTAQPYFGPAAGKAALRPGPRERAHVSAAVVPELEVLAHEDLAHLARRGQPPDELVGRERGELLCEVEDHDVARAGPAEQSRALFHVRQSGRRRSGRERAA